VRPGSLERMVARNDTFVVRLQGFAMLAVSCVRRPVAPAEVLDVWPSRLGSFAAAVLAKEPKDDIQISP
jgi:hypothetical protein